jgi:hypothetical protein
LLCYIWVPDPLVSFNKYIPSIPENSYLNILTLGIYHQGKKYSYFQVANPFIATYKGSLEISLL